MGWGVWYFIYSTAVSQGSMKPWNGSSYLRAVCWPSSSACVALCPKYATSDLTRSSARHAVFWPLWLFYASSFASLSYVHCGMDICWLCGGLLLNLSVLCTTCMHCCLVSDLPSVVNWWGDISIITPPMRLCFCQTLFVCLSVCSQDNSVMDGSFWNFECMSGMAQTTGD